MRRSVLLAGLLSFAGEAYAVHPRAILDATVVARIEAKATSAVQPLQVQ